jgi:hypothetical protein
MPGSLTGSAAKKKAQATDAAMAVWLGRMACSSKIAAELELPVSSPCAGAFAVRSKRGVS